MKLQKLSMIVLATMLLGSSTVFAEETSYKLSDAVQKILDTGKKELTDESKITFPSVEVLVGGKKVELSSPVMMIDGKTFLPVRALGNALGITVNYAPQHKVAYIDMDNIQLELPLYYNKAVKNKTTVLEIEGAKVELYKGSAYLPIRFVGENLGYKVDYKDGKINLIKK